MQQWVLQFVLISFPEAIIFLLFSLALLGHDWRPQWKRWLLFSFIYALEAQSTFMLELPHAIRLFFNILFFSFFLFLLFSFSWRFNLLLTMVRTVTQLLVESSFLLATIHLSPLSFETISNSFLNVSLFVWSYYLLVLILTFFINRWPSHPLREIASSSHGSPKYRRLSWLWGIILSIFILITVMVTILNSILVYESINLLSLTVVFPIALLTLFLSGWGSYQIIRFTRELEEKASQETEEVYLKNIDEMILQFRAQRHDFLNHLQVVSGFAQMRNIEAILNYLNSLNIENQATQSLLKLDHPPMAALLNAKASVAMTKRINFHVDVQCNLKGLKIKPFEMVKVVGNLIDNAFDEEVKVPEEDREVHVLIDNQEGRLAIEVWNRNSYIPEEQKETIFGHGYSNKKEAHTGVGLAISKQLIEKYGGDIQVESQPTEGTRFTVFLDVDELAGQNHHKIS